MPVMYSDVKLLSGFPGTMMEQVGETIRDCQRHEQTFVDNGYIHYLNCGDGFVGMYICQDIKFYTLNICILVI